MFGSLVRGRKKSTEQDKINRATRAVESILADNDINDLKHKNSEYMNLRRRKVFISDDLKKAHATYNRYKTNLKKSIIPNVRILSTPTPQEDPSPMIQQNLSVPMIQDVTTSVIHEPPQDVVMEEAPTQEVTETFEAMDVDIPVFEEVDVFMEHAPTQEVAETFEEMIVNNHVFDEVNVPMEQDLIQETTETVDVMEVDYPVFDQVEEIIPNFDDIVMQNETVQEEEDEEEYDEENEVEEDVDILDFCQNCKRKLFVDTSDDYFPSTSSLELFQVPMNTIKFRKSYKDFFSQIDRSTLVTLCKQCVTYFTHPDKPTYSCMWPSFIWYLFREEKVQSIYGDNVWKFIPISWRKWWIEAVTVDPENSIATLSNVTLESPPSYFVDISSDIKEFQDDRASQLLSRLADSANKHLMPTILCPWGGSEYIHTCGHLEYDLIIQRFLPAVHLKLISKTKVSLVVSVRDDYIRDSNYDCLLLNPKWVVKPSVSFLLDNSPMVLTNRNHDGGTKLQYIHVPRHPHYCLPAKISDQLSHGVIKPRILKHMRASNYSNTYQMIEQNGSFQGIDTCDVTNIGRFNLTSCLLNESESRTIHSRADINALLQNMADKKIITQKSVSSRRDESKRLYPTQECLEDYYYGSTYVSLNDAILTQKDIGDHKLLSVLIDVNRNDNQQYRISCKRNWPVCRQYS